LIVLGIYLSYLTMALTFFRKAVALCCFAASLTSITVVLHGCSSGKDKEFLAVPGWTCVDNELSCCENPQIPGVDMCGGPKSQFRNCAVACGAVCGCGGGDSIGAPGCQAYCQWEGTNTWKTDPNCNACTKDSFKMGCASHCSFEGGASGWDPLCNGCASSTASTAFALGPDTGGNASAPSR